MNDSKISFIGFIKEGRMVYRDKMRSDKMFRFLGKYEGLEFIEVIQAVRDAKTQSQHRFYWGVVLPALCDKTGVAIRDDMDLYCRDKFLKTIKEVNGELVPHIPSLKISDIEIDRVEYAHHIERCLQFLYDMGGALPPEKMSDDWRV